MADPDATWVMWVRDVLDLRELDAMAGQGRPDLTQGLLLDRRDAFLQAALDTVEG